MNAALTKATLTARRLARVRAPAPIPPVPGSGPGPEVAPTRGERIPLRQTPLRAWLAVPVLGGAHVWSDVFVIGEWRVQHHALTGQHRLLDPGRGTVLSGSRADCLAAVPRGLRVPAHVVILLHGLGCGHDAMEPLESALRRHGRHAVNLGYASLFRGMEENTRALGEVLDALADHGAREVSFIAYSLGGLILRCSLRPDAAWRRRLDCRRAVLLGTPNQGSQLAARLVATSLLGVAGPGGLATLPRHARSLPVPDFPFAVVMAGRGDGRGVNPWLDGDNDGVVRTAEAWLDGAEEGLFVRSDHWSLQRRPPVADAVLRYLDGGRLAAV